MAVIIPNGPDDVIKISTKKPNSVEIPSIPGGDTALWGRIHGDIRQQEDLLELISGIPEDEKEVITVLKAGADAPSVAEENDFYINTSYNKLYQYDGEDWNEVEANENVLYITADTSHIYRYDGEVFIDITGQQVGDVIYVSSIDDPALEQYTDNGIYTVCVRSLYSATYYTMAVTIQRGASRPGRPQTITYTQTLYNRDGYYARTKIGLGEWSEWTEFLYVSQDQVNELLQLIYAGL